MKFNSAKNRTTLWLGWALFGLTAVFLAVGCWHLLFSTFLQYDDEGYVLISLRGMQAGHSLYKEVFSQYGPGFYAVYNFIFGLLHLEWTNYSARVLTLVHWMLAAGLCADIVRRRTGSIAAATLTMATVVSFLWTMVSEPGHPGGAIAFFVALAAWIGARKDPANDAWSAVSLGGIVALLSLIKINVGFLLGFSLVVWFGMRLDSARGRKFAALGLAAVVAVMPWLLMRPLLNESWTQNFALLASLWGFGLVSTLQAVTAPSLKRSSVVGFVVGGLGVTSILIGYAVARGTRLIDLFDGVVLSPLRHPLIYALPPNFGPGTIGVGVLAVGLALWHLNRPNDVRLQNAIVGVRFLAGLVITGCFLGITRMMPAGFVLSYGMSLAPLFAFTLASSSKNQSPLAAWLATLAVWQSLHAFPIAGSQLNWGTFLWIPLLLIGLYDGYLALFSRGQASLAPAWIGGVARIACAVLALGLTARRFNQGSRDYRMGAALGLPGTEKIVLPEDYVHAMRAVAENAKAHGGILFSLPGMFSFNLWSGRPTPNLANVTHWFSLLNRPQQENLASALMADPKAIVIIQQGILQYLIEKKFFKSNYLSEVIGSQFYPAFDVGGYGFWIRKGRKIAPINVAEVGEPQTNEQTRRLTIRLAGKASAPVSLTLSALAGSVRSTVLRIDPQKTPLQAVALDERGDPISPLQSVAWNGPLPSGQIVELSLTLPAYPPPHAALLVVAQDHEGKVLWFAPVIRRLPFEP